MRYTLRFIAEDKEEYIFFSNRYTRTMLTYLFTHHTQSKFQPPPPALLHSYWSNLFAAMTSHRRMGPGHGDPRRRASPLQDGRPREQEAVQVPSHRQQQARSFGSCRLPEGRLGEGSLGWVGPYWLLLEEQCLVWDGHCTEEKNRGIRHKWLFFLFFIF